MNISYIAEIFCNLLLDMYSFCIIIYSTKQKSHRFCITEDCKQTFFRSMEINTQALAYRKTLPLMGLMQAVYKLCQLATPDDSPNYYGVTSF